MNQRVADHPNWVVLRLFALKRDGDSCDIDLSDAFTLPLFRFLSRILALKESIIDCRYVKMENQFVQLWMMNQEEKKMAKNLLVVGTSYGEKSDGYSDHRPFKAGH